MPYQFTTPDDIVLVRLFGVFTPRELDRLGTEAEIAEATHAVSRNRITDLTDVERFEVGFREIFNFAIRRSVQRFTRVVKSAIVARKPVQIAMARIYESVNVNSQIRVRIVSSVAEATEWFADLKDEPME
jgi:hypothetical protein